MQYSVQTAEHKSLTIHTLSISRPCHSTKFNWWVLLSSAFFSIWHYIPAPKSEWVGSDCRNQAASLTQYRTFLSFGSLIASVSRAICPCRFVVLICLLSTEQTLLSSFNVQNFNLTRCSRRFHHPLRCLLSLGYLGRFRAR